MELLVGRCLARFLDKNTFSMRTKAGMFADSLMMFHLLLKAVKFVLSPMHHSKLHHAQLCGEDVRRQHNVGKH